MLEGLGLDAAEIARLKGQGSSTADPVRQLVSGAPSTSTSSWLSQPLAISDWAVPIRSAGGFASVTNVTRAMSPLSGCVS